MTRTSVFRVGSLACLAVFCGCLERDLTALNPCLVSGVARGVTVQSIDKVDLLFVVDNSDSMVEEQDALKAQFPKLIQALTSGVRTDGRKFPALTNLHLGVVSTDMGLPGIANSWRCDPNNGGDDGKLQHDGGKPGCKASYPSFLTFEAGVSDADEVAHDFACIATLGTGGCGFEQQLEAGLKALWPKQYIDPDGNALATNPIRFLSTTPAGAFGHGDTQGGNGGFLRNDARAGLSLVAIVVVSDEEDCSSINTNHFTNDPKDPISKEPLNLRCFLHKDNLFKIQRYVDGFKALRSGNEKLVVFGAIVGVPTDLVDAAQRARFADLKDDASREAYYNAMLADDRMQEMPSSLTDTSAKLRASCYGVKADGQPAPAYPPVRIVQVARAFGAQGVVQSICAKDFGPAMDAIIDAVVDAIPTACLPRPLVRKADDLVDCNVIWELPPAAQASTGAPTECEGAGGFLEPVDDKRRARNERGGANCKVRQLPVPKSRTVPEGKGWFYDDFTAELATRCTSQEQQRISFTESGKPANGVVVKLECVNETQSLRSTDVRRMPNQPNIGSACGDAVDDNGKPIASTQTCTISLQGGGTDDSLFCHPSANVCVQKCTGQSQCPPAWVCDTRPESLSKSDGQGFCVNPTCGSD